VGKRKLSQNKEARDRAGAAEVLQARGSAELARVMAQLREGAKPPGVASGVGLEPLLQRIAEAARQRGRHVDVEVVDRVATRGDAGRLERVIGHIVQNALDATPADGRVWVTLRQLSGRVTLLVGDTGAGMDPEFIRNRLFRPFNSTKTSGMGIGSYESFQYIRELGGSIDVSSEVGRGTRVTITLPLFDVRTASDLRTAEAK
jgi:signal transduction histidine kinase